MRLLGKIVAIVVLFQVIYPLSDQTPSGAHSSTLESSKHSKNDNLSEPDCPSNRYEAAESGRQCSRRCRRDIPCENIRKRCLCDGLCGSSCIKPDLVCPDLPKIENGRFWPTRTVFGTRVQYQCDQGYFLYGSYERVCQGDEEWSGIAAICSREPMCSTPLQVNHARNPNDGIYRLNEKVEYSCYSGYEATGFAEAVCKLIGLNHTGWSWLGPPFKCSPKSCGDPGNIQNGIRIGESFIIASSVNYTCNEGYDMVGQSRRFCQSDNQWSGQPPKCEPVTCKPMDHLDNGKIIYEYPLIYGSIVDYSCDYGFRLVGPKKRRCGPEGKLDGEIPICEEIDCGQLRPLYNGYVRGYSSKIGSRAEFRCVDGMDFIGESKTSVCLETGRWSYPTPQCMASCLITEIERAIEIYAIPNDISKSYERIKVLPGSSIRHDTELDVICENGFELDEQISVESTIQLPTCFNGTWSFAPRCKPASCLTQAKTFKNGRIIMASVEHGSKGYLRCVDGFRLVGESFITCISGNWTTIKSSCVELFCSYPGQIENGRILLIGLTGMYDYKPYIRKVGHNRQIAYECDSGYRLNDGAPSGATCINGIWRPEGLPNCIKE